MVSEPDAATTRAWTAIGGAPDLIERVSYRSAGRVLPAVLPVRELARATVGACSLAGAELMAARNGGPVPEVRVDEGAVATAFVSERHLLVDGRALTPFAPLSGFWRTADGWVRTHANYPHHRSRLLAALEIDTGDAHDRSVVGGAGAGPEDDRGAGLVGRLTERLAALGAREVQESVHAAGGLAVAVAPAPEREPDTGSTARGLPLAEVGTGGAGRRRLPPGALPASGVRVLDLTRVIAGPVATRTLALLGADVLRVDPPGLPEDPDSHVDTGFGKRSALVDLDSAEGRRAFARLLDSADVVVTGYRPGALDRYGLTPEALLSRRPGLVVAGLCAWGWSGHWSGRRGFDSLVQAARGIAAIEAAPSNPSNPSDPSGRPGALPAQALDHGTGYLLAAGVLRALTDRQADGRGRVLRFSLAGTADWLLHGIAPEPVGTGTYDAADHLTEAPSPYGLLRHALPPVHYEGAPETWADPPTRWGTDTALWR
ncbi:CoA transferase [Nocardiopsis sp. NRRL B-16309]|uniref:CoA transferase n=1 Tax=Nocardiopsis sp. NRRL B-16309 TaxID=1519494 RepID=UPI0006B06817|nr:CoA transferase [Nocardiopsis sp. NRRL B-16309]KOX17322.1 carnitine dehydratase [Nocardiopsis sp. NRRL B-16309]